MVTGKDLKALLLSEKYQRQYEFGMFPLVERKGDIHTGMK